MASSWCAPSRSTSSTGGSTLGQRPVDAGGEHRVVGARGRAACRRPSSVANAASRPVEPARRAAARAAPGWRRRRARRPRAARRRRPRRRPGRSRRSRRRGPRLAGRRRARRGGRHVEPLARRRAGRRAPSRPPASAACPRGWTSPSTTAWLPVPTRTAALVDARARPGASGSAPSARRRRPGRA